MFALAKKVNEQPGMLLLRMVGQIMATDRKLVLMLSKSGAQRKFALFLLDLVDRLSRFGCEQNKFTLAISRADIANYLGLTVETVSRLFTRLQSRGLLVINRRRLKILNMQALRVLANDHSRAPANLEEAS